jgi:uridine phosphorylase
VANTELVSQLIASSEEAGITFHAGITHCKDSFFSEIPEYTAHPSMTELRWATWQRAHALATEMEAAVLYVLSSLRGCRGGAILSVVGSTIDGELIADKSGVQKVVEVGVEAMRRMIQHDRQEE